MATLDEALTTMFVAKGVPTREIKAKLPTYRQLLGKFPEELVTHLCLEFATGAIGANEFIPNVAEFYQILEPATRKYDRAKLFTALNHRFPPGHPDRFKTSNGTIFFPGGFMFTIEEQRELNRQSPKTDHTLLEWHYTHDM